MKKAILIIFAMLSACGQAPGLEGSLNPDSGGKDLPAETQAPPPGQYRAEVLRDLGLGPDNGFTQTEIAELAREFVYVNNVWPVESTEIDPALDFHHYYVEWKSGSALFFCGGSSYLLAWMLEEIGIPARAVQLASQDFIDGLSDTETHVTVEAFIDGNWLIEDPTFNVAFECDGETASVLDLVECLANDGEITWIPGEKYFGFGHTIEEYPVPFAKHLAAYSFNNPYVSRLRYEKVPDFPSPGW